MSQISILVGTVVEWVALFPHSEKITGVNSSRDFSLLCLRKFPLWILAFSYSPKTCMLVNQ